MQLLSKAPAVDEGRSAVDFSGVLTKLAAAMKHKETQVWLTASDEKNWKGMQVRPVQLGVFSCDGDTSLRRDTGHAESSHAHGTTASSLQVL